MSIRLERISLTCPLCARKFTSMRMIGYQIGGKDSDFCPRYAGGNPMPKLLHLCPSCGFVGYVPDFQGRMKPEMRGRLRRVLSSLGYQPGSSLAGPERFRRAAVLAVYQGKPNVEIAELFLQATWCSRLDSESDEMESRARRKAVEYFERALKAGEVSDDDKPVLLYLLGELKRRLGKHDEALQLFRELDRYRNVDGWLRDLRNKQRASIRHKPSKFDETG